MKLRLRSRLVFISSMVLLVTALLVIPLTYTLTRPKHTAAAPAHLALDCSKAKLCADPTQKYDEDHAYIGHDEPSLLFYSNVPGSGNQMQYQLVLPKDPPVRPTQADGNVSANFQLHPTFWFGMAMCDTQSYPLQVSTCAPDSDSNIVDVTKNPNHPGGAFMEMQFYPPGWVQWPNIPGSCDPTQWCAALNIDSLSEDPVNNTVLNRPCSNFVSGGSDEYVNFAFITLNGRPQGPANPVDSTLASFTPDHARDLFMNSGDLISVSFRDTAHGLHVEINDKTTHQVGSMTASAENGFGQVKYAPAPSTECTNIPYDFHPMYSTSSEKTDVPWTAHGYNVAFSDEIGHFDYCSDVPADGDSCAGLEGSGNDLEPADDDDNFCFQQAPAGCVDTNAGFDGVSYQKVWPDGDTQHHPTPILFTSPLTGNGFHVNYSRVAFEADTPALEPLAQCALDGTGCTIVPLTDEGVEATFYPFYSIGNLGNQCYWAFGNDIPGFSRNDFGKDNQYGTILLRNFQLPGSGFIPVAEDYRQVLAHNPCRAGQGGQQ
ncbi:MAG TPA: hypothetical protein VH540_28465 [Ktedonobacterales bacterium]